MAKKIDPSLRKVGEYLKIDKSAKFIIPEYQRPYSWSIENCDKLWQDIKDFMDNNSYEKYFFGTVILSCEEDVEDSAKLIDGQQRTTTFLLLLKALLIVINEQIKLSKNCSEEFENLLDGLISKRKEIMYILYNAKELDVLKRPDQIKDAILFDKFSILENNSNNEKFKNDFDAIIKSYDFEEARNKVTKIKFKQKDNAYTNFFKNFKFFYNRLKELNNIDDIYKISKIILGKCQIILIESWNVEQAITMFNSLNSDGLPLNDADILSAKFYAQAKSINKSEKFSEIWKDFLDEVEVLSSKGLMNIDSILGQYMYINRAKNGDIVNSSGGINVTVPGVRRYYLNENKELIKNSIKTCSEILNLTKIWNYSTEIPVISILLKFNENSKYYLGCYFSRFFGSDDVIKEIKLYRDELISLSETMLRLFALLELVDYGYSSSKFKTFLFRETPKLVDKNSKIDEIIDDFDNHIKKEFSINNIKDNIAEYNKNLLVYLNEYLFAKEISFIFSLNEKLDIEHIMPASGHNISAIRESAKIDNKEEFDEIVNKIGNKILLEQKINRSIGNDWFTSKVKKHDDNKFCYVNSKYPIATSLKIRYKNVEEPKWEKNDILNATDEAVERIANFIFKN